jgi:hypothetical protein
LSYGLASYLRNDSKPNRKKPASATHTKSATSADSQRLKDTLTSLTTLLSALPIDEAAKASGFIKRQSRKLTGVLFVQAAILLVAQGAVSLRRWAVLIGVLGNLTLSKQALWERISPRAVEFLRTCLGLVVGRNVVADRSLPGALEHFKRVLVQDSTLIKLCPGLAKIFPGSANHRGSKSGQLRIQAVYDLVTQQFLSFSLSSFRRNDQAAAFDILSLVGKGDLVLRDLGYFVLGSLQQIADAGAFFLSRLRCDCGLWDATTGKPLDLLKQLKRYGNLDCQVLVGAQRLPCRLVAIKLDDATAAERRRRARFNRDKRCHPSQRDLQLLGWSLFITNVPHHQVSAQAVARIYGLRWRIETLFKSWKSHFKITTVPQGSAVALQVIIYARLIFLTAFAQSCQRGWLAATEQPPAGRSLLQLAALVADYLLVLFLESQHQTITSSWLLQLDCQTGYGRRNRENFQQTIMK